MAGRKSEDPKNQHTYGSSATSSKKHPKLFIHTSLQIYQPSNLSHQNMSKITLQTLTEFSLSVTWCSREGECPFYRQAAEALKIKGLAEGHKGSQLQSLRTAQAFCPPPLYTYQDSTKQSVTPASKGRKQAEEVRCSDPVARCMMLYSYV